MIKSQVRSTHSIICTGQYCVVRSAYSVYIMGCAVQYSICMPVLSILRFSVWEFVLYTSDMYFAVVQYEYEYEYGRAVCEVYCTV